MKIIDSVSDRESEQYLDESSKRYTERLGILSDIVGGYPQLKESEVVKSNSIRLSDHYSNQVSNESGRGVLEEKDYCEFCYQEITNEDKWQWGRYGIPHCNETQFGLPEVICP